MVEKTYSSRDERDVVDDLETIEMAPANSREIRCIHKAFQTKTIIGNPRLRFVREHDNPLLQMTTNQLPNHTSRYPTLIYPGAYVIEGGKSPLIVQTSGGATSFRRRSPPIESWSVEKDESDPSSLTSDVSATTEAELFPLHSSRKGLTTIY
jgi:hypothetical protein